MENQKKERIGMMRMKIKAVAFLTGAALFLGAGVAYAGKVELTTYYPAPNGEYQDLQATNSLTVPVKTVAPADEGSVAVGEIWVQ